MAKKAISSRKTLLIDKSSFEYREAFKVLRTNLQFSSADNNIKKIAVTSTGPFEGKTTVTVNLALTLAEAGLHVLLIDADLRKPRVHKMLDFPAVPGLTNLLTKQSELMESINKVEGYETLDVITCGVIPPNPAELLGSHQMQNFIDSVVDKYDYIIIDTPPVSFVTDAAVLSKMLDGTILVISYGRTVIEAAQFAKQTLESVGANILGCVFNRVEMDSYGNRGFYRRHGYINRHKYDSSAYAYKYGKYDYKYDYKYKENYESKKDTGKEKEEINK